MCAAREYKKNTKGGEEEKNCHLKFKNERNFLHSPYYPPTHILCLFIPYPYFPSPKLAPFFPPLSLSLPPYILALSLPSLLATQLSCYPPSLFSLRQFPRPLPSPTLPPSSSLSLPPYILALSFPSVFDITYQLYFSVNAFSYSIS